ncbi:hypothetical protein SAMN04487907_104116 [Zunongwangia mangrovi]|uniref:Uncharacterized protein n=1 Tax=Zunongwangia mangrovi TaxID=1334022 RepID=A0A1I1J0G2_9FLAO|nr:hypothetical protein SAMN04487907_104116 [Zunongwangia mangrovi]
MTIIISIVAGRSGLRSVSRLASDLDRIFLDVENIDINWIKNKMEDYGIKRKYLIEQHEII